MHFAVAGCGVISRFHLDAIRSIEDAALCGVYDPVEASARAAAQAYGTRAYPDYDALLADPQVDAVCICTPSHLHAPLALQAVAAGKHVLIEKPVALTLEDCDAVAAAARAAGVQVGVVSQLRYGPAVARVKRALESGALGRITRCDLYMKYFRPQSYYDSGTWRGTQAMDGGGALMNQGIHGVDLVRYLMGPADSIYALSGTLVRDIEVEDTLTAVVAWHCGAQGVIQASVGDYPGFPRRIELNGESGTIILEEDRIVKWEVAGDSAYHIYEQEPAPEVRSHSEAGAIDPSGHVAQLRNFIDAVRGEGTLLVDEAEGRKALALVLAAYRSAAAAPQKKCKKGRPEGGGRKWKICQEEFLQIWYSIGGQKSTRGTSTRAFAQKRRCLEPTAPGYSFKRDPCARPELMPCTGRADRSSGPFGNNVSSGGHL